MLVKQKKVLFIPDIHCPYQDKKALNAMYSFMKWWKPETIIILGDLVDFYAISKYNKDPRRALKLQKELDEAKKVIMEIRKLAPKSEIHFLYGNHCDRLKAHKWSNAKEFAYLRSLELENLLHFDELNIISHPDGKMKYKGLLVKHGNVVRKFAGYTAKAEFEKSGMSGLSGHCFDNKTELLTKRGWINGLKLNNNDIVGTMNKETKLLEWNKINEFFQYDNYKKLYHIKGSAINLLVTDKHGLIYETEHNIQKEIEAKDMLTAKSKLKFYNCVLSNNNEQKYEIDKQMLRLLVDVITDGSFEQNAIRWHLNKERKIKHLIELLNHFNLKYSNTIQKNGNTRIRINVESSKEIYKILDYKKVVPKWFVDLTPELVEVVLQEYAITDGCKNSAAKNSYQLSSAKEFEMDILQEMFVRNGYRATKTKHRTTWILTVNTKRKTSLLLKTNCSVEKYDGKVWCVNVNNGTLLVRRNGKVSVTLNTHRLSTYRHTNESGDYIWVEAGCLCDPKAEYLKGQVANWQQGFAIGYFKNNSNRYLLETVPIVKGKAMYGGMEF